MKKIISVVIFTLVILTNTVAISYSATKYIDSKFANQGVIAVKYEASTDTRIRLLVEKEGSRYTYNINNNEVERFPLQMGSGEYVVKILENIEGNKYREVYKETIKIELKGENEVFLNSIQEISWDASSKAIEKAKELTKTLASDEEKVDAIYNYIIDNISYDYDKINNLSNLYLPNIDETVENGKGICYDYASLFAAMLRSVDIPTKMIKGYAPGITHYHAWNQVYIKSVEQWVTIDTSYDAQLKEKKQNVTKYKNAELYQPHREY